MIVSVASDHAGFDLKMKVEDYLREKGYEVLDGGAETSGVPYSYVLAGQKAAQDVVEGRADRGVVICGTGLGISIVANKFKGVRCALCVNEYMARMSRQHNDANVLAMGARVVGSSLAISIVDAFFSESFDGGRHAVRVADIAAQEEKQFK